MVDQTDSNEQYTEDQIRALVGAPSIEESQTCICGSPLKECSECYEHMSSGC
jgi:hypothetical protein